MAQRFSTISRYQRLVLAHGVIAAMVFTFIVPVAVMIARFHKSPPLSYRYHAYMQVVAIGLATAAFVLGYFAVGPARSLTNPHHGIGVAIYTLILVQGIGGRIIKNIGGRSLRVTLHRWMGRAIVLLGIVQVPLGLTLYGSPKYLFVLYTIWMTFLLVVYFVYSFLRENASSYRTYGSGREGSRSEVSGTTDESGGGGGGGFTKLLGPLAALAGLIALLKSKNDRKRSPSPSRSSRVSRSHSGAPETLSSRRPYRGPERYFTESEKYSEYANRKGGGFLGKLLGVAASAGGGALLSKIIGGGSKGRASSYRDEYSTVSSETPTTRVDVRRHQRPDVSEVTDETEDVPAGRRTPLLPPPVQSGLTDDRPTTPRPSHRPRPGISAISGVDESDYSSYMSASPSKHKPHSSGVGNGVLAGLGLGWLAKKMKDRRDGKERRGEEERRSGAHGFKYTGDGYSSPSRRQSRRHSAKPSPPPAGRTSSLIYDSSELSSALEPRPSGSSQPGPPMPPPAGSIGAVEGSTGATSNAPSTRIPAPAAGAPVPPPPGSCKHSHSHSHSRSRSRRETSPLNMPPMPDDPRGVLARVRDADSSSEEYHSPGGHPHRGSSRRRRGDAAAAQALASASRLAAEEEEERRRTASAAGGAPSAPVLVSVQMHQDRDRTVTLRQLPEEEREKKSTQEPRRRQRVSAPRESVSSLSGVTDSLVGSNNRRYRRESGERRGSVSTESDLAPPAPPFAGRKTKDSAYYSGGAAAAGPSSSAPPPTAAGPTGATVSSLGSPDPYWSPGTSNAGSRREKRRASRRRPSASNAPVDFL